MNRALLPLLLPALLATGCAGHAPPRFGDGPPPADRGEPHRLFVSPAGEPFRSARGTDPERVWFDGADTDHDGRLTPAEMRADALRFFATLDTNGDGEIDPAEIERYETVVFPELRVGGGDRAGPRASDRHGPGGGGRTVGGRHGGGEGPSESSRSATPRTPQRQGAGRYAYLDLPEPVTAADRNLNRGIDREEIARAVDDRFALLDTAHHGYLAWSDLPHVAARATPPRGIPPRRQGPDVDDRPPPGEGE